MSTKFGVILAARGGVRSSPPSRPPRPPRLNRPRLQQRGELRDGTGAGGWWGWGTGTDEGRGGGGPHPRCQLAWCAMPSLCTCAAPKCCRAADARNLPAAFELRTPRRAAWGRQDLGGTQGCGHPAGSPRCRPPKAPREGGGGEGGGGGRWRHPRIPACLLAVGGTGPGRDQVALCIKPLGRLL